MAKNRCNGEEAAEVVLRALGARDLATLEHSRRVSKLAALLAGAAGVALDERETIRLGALLHDIGKIGIPDAILFKPARLTPDEQKVMEQHPAIGSSILSPVAALGRAAEIVLHHHERYNGAGYPSHCKGEAIPLGARVVAVVDSFDALTHARPYREALPVETALAEIRNASGTMYDPCLARVFSDLAARGALPHR